MFGNGLTLSQSFNRRYEPLSVLSGPVSLTYTPTPAGDVGAIADRTTDASGCVRNATQSATFDFLDRLQSWSQTVQAGTGTCPADDLSGLLTGATYVQQTDQIASLRTPDQSGRPRYAFGYDYEGNVSAVGQYDSLGSSVVAAVCLRHDALGRIVLAGTKATAFTAGAAACVQDGEISSVLVRFKYDAQNHRLARQQSGQWTYILPDASGNPLSELVLVNGVWTKVRDYIWLDGRPLAQIEYSGSSANVYYAHVDSLGTPRALTNANWTVVWSTFQLPYGEVREHAAPDPLSGLTVVTNLRLPGQYDERLLGNLGLQGPYYNWNRWYLPGVGRYLEADPIALAGGTNGRYGPDWYSYANDDPLRSTDPSGLFAMQGKCTLWREAKELAKKWAGCGGGGDKCMDKCSKKLEECKSKSCDICKTIDNAVPARAQRNLNCDGKDANGCYTQENGVCTAVVFEENICDAGPGDGPAALADAIFHEAVHCCREQTGVAIGDSGSCSAKAISDACKQ